MTATLVRLAWRDLRASGRVLWVFCACLVLGVTLIAASGGLFAQVRDSLLADTRAMFGGDLEVRTREPLDAAALDWLRARGAVSLLVELRTMMVTADDRFQLVELQSVDAAYPLYGEVELRPAQAIGVATAQREDGYGVAVDPVLAERLGLALGDRVQLGGLEVTVRAVVTRQPDRSLRADWRGPPVLLDDAALAASGLLGPGSRAEWHYRVRADEAPKALETAFADAFPDVDWEVRSFADRSDRLAKVLGQVGAGLMLIGFSALFIGGLGVFNSVHAYLQGKLATVATLRALGLRDRRLAAVYLVQVLMLAAGSSLVGVLLGGGLALLGTGVIAERLPVAPDVAGIALPLVVAWTFGVLTALTFAFPALGRALSISPAALFRGIDAERTRTPASWWLLTAAGVTLVALLLLVAVPDPWFGLGFLVVTLILLALLEALVRGLRSVAHRLVDGPQFSGRFTLRLALANLYRPGSSLRPALLSMGTALTLLVASAMVVGTLLRTIDETIPERAPALVFYDIQAPDLERFRALLAESPSLERADLAPLVLGRLAAVNGVPLSASDDPARRMEARDEHKLSYRANNFDQVVVERGAWWPEDHDGPPRVAFEDREADQLGLEVGDRLTFSILGEALDAELAAIYSQRNFQARFWLEGIFSDGVLDPFVTRYVGAAIMDDGEALAAQARIAAAMPNVVTIRTADLLAEARSLLGKASAALAVIAAVSLVASLLVLVSLLASSRARQVYDAILLHTLGTRTGVIRRALAWEYALLGLLTGGFALLGGGGLALALLRLRLELDTEITWWLGFAVALVVSLVSLGLGARWLLAQLRLNPSRLLRSSG